MPKANITSVPISALFALNKPSGPTSMSVINDVKKLVASSRLFVPESVLAKQSTQKKGKGKRGSDAVKIGQGGTLDPLADGVLVVGVGKGTKKLTQFLDCVKEYRTTCLLGCETDTYDSEGAQVRTARWRHVTREAVETALGQFRGQIKQTPPIFSALKMDGKPLYEYAREGIPLPRPIEAREVTVHSLEVTKWLGSEHNFRWPNTKFSDDQRHAMEKALQGVDQTAKVEDDPATERVSPAADATEGSTTEAEVPTAFELTMRVSGGTYVRSIVHDLGHAIGSAAHVVTLTRSKQGRFTLNPQESENELGCVPWEVFTKALEDKGEKDDDGWYEWEREVQEKLEFVEGGRNVE